MYKKFIKRTLDIFFSIILMPIVLVEIFIVAPIIYVEDHGSVFYVAKRRGLNGKIFSMYKFRTMKVNSPDIRNDNNSTFNSYNDPRVTNIGRLLRKTSLDELPQIINVLKGDMSFIGPRASIPTEGITWDDLNDIQKKRLTVRPGITGYSAALYRNSIDKMEKQKLDCYYVDKMSFFFDIKIILWTFKMVLSQKNLYTNDSKKKDI